MKFDVCFSLLISGVPFVLFPGVMLADGRALEESVTARIRAHLRQALHVDDHGILRATSTNTPLSSSSSSGPSGSELEDGSAENGSRAGPGPFTRMISLQVFIEQWALEMC